MRSSPRASFRHRSARRVLAAVLAAAGALRQAGPAKAEQPATVAPSEEEEPTGATSDERTLLLVRTPGDDGVMTRLRAEVVRGKWRVLEIRPDERFEPPPIGRVAAQQSASAAVRVDVQRGTIELWVRRPEGPVEEVLTAPSDDHVLALRTAEALRARGLVFDPPAPPPTDAEAPLPSPMPGPSPERDAPSRPTLRDSARARRFWLELGPSLMLGPGGLAPLAGAELGARLELTARWSAAAVGFVPLARSSLAAPEGEAAIASSLAGALLELEWLRLDFGGFSSGIGAAGSVTTMSGRAREDFQGTNDTVFAFAPLARTTFHVALGRSFRLCAAATAGSTFPKVRVVFGDREVASWGRPFVVTSVVLEASPASL